MSAHHHLLLTNALRKLWDATHLLQVRMRCCSTQTAGSQTWPSHAPILLLLKLLPTAAVAVSCKLLLHATHPAIDTIQVLHSVLGIARVLQQQQQHQHQKHPPHSTNVRSNG